ncbi:MULTISPECIES: type II toxin-antitoxin system RelE/ParE family toxin [Dyadobacter]|uniref:type II toxin-antitoxin system RelE/ParE family toxin n=1 Tax=Dyadobacter TaxID=120831 RepID=UPI0038D3A4CD
MLQYGSGGTNERSQTVKKNSPAYLGIKATYNGNEIRLLAFWDKSDTKNTLVVASNGFIKKSAKIPSQEIQRALRIRARYFEEQQ